MIPAEFVKKVADQYRKVDGIFSNKINAEELVPQNLSDLNKARFIFYVLQLDYAMKSQTLYLGG